MINRLFLAHLVLMISLTATYSQQTNPRFRVCHGYDCHYRTIVNLTPSDVQAIQNLMLTQDAAAERLAIKKAVAIFEERSTAVIGVRDEPKMQFGRPNRKGQMDCVDESTNTDGFLRYLQASGLLHFHTVSKRDSRGFFLDGRYPHWTAVIVDQGKTKWAVDSWYEAGGGEPDIMLLKEWKKHGKNGTR